MTSCQDDEENDALLSSYSYDLPKESIAQHPLLRGTSRLCIVDKDCMDMDSQAASPHIQTAKPLAQTVKPLAQTATLPIQTVKPLAQAVMPLAQAVMLSMQTAKPLAQAVMPWAQACGRLQHSSFDDLLEALPPNALLVANNSRVVPTRLFGQRPTGGRVECLLLTPLPQIQAEKAEHPVLNACSSACVEVLIKPAKHAPVGASFSFAQGEIQIEVLEKGAFGKHRVQMYWKDRAGESHCALEKLLEEHGHLPLPPYIQRDDTLTDRETYQTSYAQHAGSIAAPTAGLHFTPSMRQRLLDAGFDWAELTLHVGYGTFSPVRCEDIREHDMHPEYVVLDAATCQRIAEAKANKRPIIAIGTTATRTLEAIANLYGGKLQPHTGSINIFIRPGYKFQVIDGLLTNFHLPESSLLMLVSALLGRKRTLAIYAEAVREGYRFFSYGDAMLIR